MHSSQVANVVDGMTRVPFGQPLTRVPAGLIDQQNPSAEKIAVDSGRSPIRTSGTFVPSGMSWPGHGVATTKQQHPSR